MQQCIPNSFKYLRIYLRFGKVLKLNYLDGIGEKVQWISLGTGSTKIFQVSGP